MARFIGSLSEGSLVRRTLVCVGTFALGSTAFIAVVSFLLVTIARAVLPSPDAADPAKEDAEAATEETAAGAQKPPTSKAPRAPKRTRAAPTEAAESADE